ASVRSQSEPVAASPPSPDPAAVLANLDINANELALVDRARGMDPDAAEAHARKVLSSVRGSGVGSGLGSVSGGAPVGAAPHANAEVVGSGWSAALSSFLFFASGALIPILPFIFGASSVVAAVLACMLVGIALMCTGGIVGVLSGTSPGLRALRQLAIGLGAAGITYGLGNLFGVALG
ncbi:VIT1/CCC1 transporter family protein, partial [Corynebacterium durum]|uniref:VIT1/CCC1 transporter family protein n=1 Tax=Corynebacterium durum TaxID=61592 RepID=UPI00288070EA